jgi:hypothetical protein
MISPMFLRKRRNVSANHWSREAGDRFKGKSTAVGRNISEEGCASVDGWLAQVAMVTAA